jgi:hypothetical protein
MIFKSPKLKNWGDAIFCPHGMKLQTFPLFFCNITPNLLTKSNQNSQKFANWRLLVVKDLKSTFKNSRSKIPTYPPFANIEPNPFGLIPKPHLWNWDGNVHFSTTLLGFYSSSYSIIRFNSSFIDIELYIGGLIPWLWRTHRSSSNLVNQGKG